VVKSSRLTFWGLRETGRARRRRSSQVITNSLLSVWLLRVKYTTDRWMDDRFASVGLYAEPCYSERLRRYVKAGRQALRLVETRSSRAAADCVASAPVVSERGNWSTCTRVVYTRINTTTTLSRRRLRDSRADPPLVRQAALCVRYPPSVCPSFFPRFLLLPCL